MTRVSVSTTPIDTASLSKYGNILLAMGENVDDAIKTNRGTFKLIDDVYKMATQPKKGWQVITTRTLVFSVSVCRGDKSFTTVHVDKTGRNIYENDKDL